MWREAVEYGVACMVGMPEASDAQLVERLTSLGMEAWLAEHLVQWLPLAYAERVFQGVRLIRTYAVVGGADRSLDDEPIFLAACERAKEAGREECLAVAPRSSIHNAISNGAKAASERGVPFDMRGDAAVSLFSALPPIEPGDGGVPRANERIQALIRAHGFASLPKRMRFETRVFPRITANAFYVCVELVVHDPRIVQGRIVESVLGEGPTLHRAVAVGIEKLSINVLHALLASLIDNSACADHVEWAEWRHRDGRLRACIGQELVLHNPEHVPDATALLHALEAALAHEPLAKGFHALRVFTLHEASKTLADEVLLDGASWPKGLAILKAHAWPKVDVKWGLRWFAVLEAFDDAAPRRWWWPW